MVTRGRVKPLVTLLLAVALVVPAGSWGAGISSAAAATPTDAAGGAEIYADDAAVMAQAEALWALDAAERESLVGEMAVALELDVAEQSAWPRRSADVMPRPPRWHRPGRRCITTVTTTLGAEQEPVAIASLVAVAAEAPSIGEGMFGGYIVVALGAEGAVTSSNDLRDGKPVSEPIDGRPGWTVDLSQERARMAVDATNERDGLKTVLKTTVDVAPCPTADGTFEASATIDVSATMGSVGQNGTFEVKVRGQVDDNARMVSSDAEYRMQWAKFSGPRRTVRRREWHGRQVGSGLTLRRSGGAATPELVRDAAGFGALNAAILQHFLIEAAKKGWESGRCVRLDTTPSAGPKGLDPGQVVSLTAAPRSKIDGSAVGGSVSAALTAGGATVAPSDTKVPADATFSYSAPDQDGGSGTISLEARSKRGVGKATLDLATSVMPTVTIAANLRYTFSGGASGTATIDLTMKPSPDGSYTGTAEVHMTGSMKMLQTKCERAKWTETIELSGIVTSEDDDQVLVISTTGEAPRGKSRPMKCTTAGTTVPSRTPLLSSSLFGEVRVHLADGEQAFLATASSR